MLYAKGTMHPPLLYIYIVTYIGVFYYITIGGACIINESRRVARYVQSVTFSWKRMKERRGGVTKS